MHDHRKNGISEIDTTNEQRIVCIDTVSQFRRVSGIYNVESVVAKTMATEGETKAELARLQRKREKHRRHACRRSDFQGGVPKMSHSY